MKKLILITATVLFMQTSNAQSTIDYFGQTPPGDKAVKFAPDIISMPDRMECKIIFSPDGNECYFTVIENNIGKTYYKKRVNNAWSEQVEAPFSTNKSVYINCFSADGSKLYFDDDNDIWVVERTAGGWGEPQLLPSPINSSSYDRGYTETSDSVVYIYSNRPGSFVGTWGENWDIWRIGPSSIQAENMGSGINTKVWQDSPCVAPDGSYLIYSQSSNDYESSFLLISFNKGNGKWTTPVKMNIIGEDLNIPYQNSPNLSPDGKYLFFQRHDPVVMDIYWVSTSIIDTLKKIAMPTTLVNQAIDKKVLLYPNPTNGHITLSLGTSQNREALVEIYNLQGAQVFSKIFKNTPSATIDLTGNSAGIYVVKVIADGVIYEEKIMKE